MKYLSTLIFSLILIIGGLFALPRAGQAAASVTVTAPNSGQAFTLGQNITITWTQTDLDSVSVGISRGGSFTTLLARDVERTETGGSYQWTAPTALSDIGTDYKITVKGWQDGNATPVEDSSDLPFGIIEPDYTPVSVRSSGPGGKTLSRDTSNINIAAFTISNASSSPKVRIDVACRVEVPSGVTNRGLSTRVRIGSTTIADHTDSLDCGFTDKEVYINSGQSVTVSVDISNAEGAAIKQFDFNATLFVVTAQTASSTSLRIQGLPAKGATFTLPSRASLTTQLSLSSPSNNETWKPNEKRTVRWTAKNLPLQAANQVVISFIKTDGSLIGPLFKFSNTNSSAQITVPTLAVANNNYRLRIFLECNTYVAACSAQADSPNTVYVIGSNPSVSQPQASANTTPAAITDQANRIVQSGTDLNTFLSYRKIKRSSKDQEYSMRRYAMPLIGSERLTQQQTYSINNFIVYGVPAKQGLNARQRYELLVKYKNNNRGVPKTVADWQKLLS